MITTNAGPALEARRAAHRAEGHEDGSAVPNLLLPCCRDLVTQISHTQESGGNTYQGRPRNPFQSMSTLEELALRAWDERRRQ